MLWILSVARALTAAFLLLAVGAATMSPRSVAHEWYPHECCHGQDCAVVTALDVLPGGGMRVETAHGVGTVPRGYPARPSRDHRAHACLRPMGPEEEHRGWMVVCLFLPGSV